MDEQKVKEEQELCRMVENLRQEHDEIRSNLGDLDGSDWSANSEAGSINLSSTSNEERVDQVQQELDSLESKGHHFKAVENEIQNVCQNISDKNTPDKTLGLDSKVSLDYLAQIEELRIAKKEMEIKLQLLKKRYEEELSSFEQIRVEHIFKNSGAKEYLERLKDRNKLKDDIIKSLKEELEYKNKEVADLQERCLELERTSIGYQQAWKEAQLKKEQLEAEKANQERERRQYNKNLSSASSLVDQVGIPPPPPIEIPSIAELMGNMTSHQDTNPYSSMDSSIPPPPHIEVPFDELIRPAQPSSQTSYHYGP